MKLRLPILILLFVGFGLDVKSQDLVPYSGLIVNTSLYTSDLFDIRFQIRNIGSFTTPNSYIGIRISQYNNYNTSQMTSLGYVSVEKLSPSQISNVTEYKLPLPYTIATGTYYVYIVADNSNIISETNETNNIGLISGTISITKSHWQYTRQNIPHPILFIHGWVGDNLTWLNFADSVLNKQYGWSNGGVLDFCLNYDNNIYTGELYNDFHNYTSPSNLVKGDYYFINFDIDADGNWISYEGPTNCQSQSNQSAIRKQGYAIKEAIQMVRSKTGADKVILVGHSMGGLAAREYIQRWTQSDGQHHVAKLFTCGTPNQGANSTAWGFGGNGRDEKSEAVRDLRRSYFDSGKDGAYLFGGYEYYSWIKNNISFNYHNVDVNCNGIDNTGEQIFGLDNENFVDINYSCIIGTGDGGLCPGMGSYSSDGVVEDWSANLNNGFLNLGPDYIDTFIVNPLTGYNCWTADFLHTNLTKSPYGIYNMQGLDEPDLFDDVGYGHAYDIGFNKLYYGTITPKNKDPFNSNGIDYDDYKFVLNTTSNLTFNIYNINIPNMEVQIYDANQNPYTTVGTNGGQGNMGFTLSNIPAGTYYLEIRGLATMSPSTWYRAYGFQITNPNSTTDISENEISFLDVNVFPNPSSGNFNIDISSDIDGDFDIQILNPLGEIVYEEKKVSKGKHTIIADELANGMYAVRVNTSHKTISKSIVIVK